MNALECSKESELLRKRQRRIIHIFDCIGNVAAFFAMHPEDVANYVFSNIDEEDNCVDSIIWDFGYFWYSSYKPVMNRWLEQGYDIIRMLVEGSKRRKKECLFNYRMNRVAWKPSRISADKNPPYPWELQPHENMDLRIKQQNPDWCLQSWHKEPLFNYAAQGVQDFAANEIETLMTKYDFDGFQLDFARHVPVLPPGEQWLHKDRITDFLKLLRNRLSQNENVDHTPVVGVRVPCCEEGCRIDGLDVQTWASDRLVDLMVIGARTMAVDIHFFKRITTNTHIGIYPCMDGHHTTDAYVNPGLEWYRGLASSWLDQSADGFTVFNFGAARPDVQKKYHVLFSEHPNEHKNINNRADVLIECGSSDKMAYENKMVALERRGGYRWSEGFFNQNMNAPLPFVLSSDEKTPLEHTVLKHPLYMADDVSKRKDRIQDIFLTVVLHGVIDSDSLIVKCNGITLSAVDTDTRHKDPQIKPQELSWSSGGSADRYHEDPKQHLVKITYRLSPEICARGNQYLEISLKEPNESIVTIEKVELHVLYRTSADTSILEA